MSAMYVTQAGDVLDLICYRHYGRQSGAVEAVLEANPRLADRGPVFTAGVRIVLPDLPQPAAEERLVTLWD